MSEKQSLSPKGRITVRIIDEGTGIREIKKVHAVRIQSKDYVLLIMDDYAPTLGEINGRMAILTEDNEEIYDSVRGFYRLKDNEFTFVINTNTPV